MLTCWHARAYASGASASKTVFKDIKPHKYRKARAEYDEHFKPLLCIQGLESHAALDDIMAKIWGADAALTDEEMELAEEVNRLSSKRQRMHVKIAASRAAHAACPSVITWFATGLHPR